MVSAASEKRSWRSVLVRCIRLYSLSSRDTSGVVFLNGRSTVGA
jgi:hypothetical protein